MSHNWFSMTSDGRGLGVPVSQLHALVPVRTSEALRLHGFLPRSQDLE